jgi:hypothetical protein
MNKMNNYYEIQRLNDLKYKQECERMYGVKEEEEKMLKYDPMELNPGGVKYPSSLKDDEFEKFKEETRKMLVENQKSQKVFHEEIRARFKMMKEKLSQKICYTPLPLPSYIYTTKGFLKLNKYIVDKEGDHYLLGEGKVGRDVQLWQKIHECYEKKNKDVFVTWGEKKHYIDDIMLVRGDPVELINKLKLLQTLKEQTVDGMGLIEPRIICHENGKFYKLHFDQELPEKCITFYNYNNYKDVEGEELFYYWKPVECGVML